MAPLSCPATPLAQRIWPLTYQWFGLFRVRSPLLTESLDCFLFLQVLRCFSSLGWLPLAYVFSQGSPGLARRGFPIRKSTGKLASSKPWLIAGSYVLLRLSVPRHPPHALTSLVKKNLTSTGISSLLEANSQLNEKSRGIAPPKTLVPLVFCALATLAFNCQRTSMKATSGASSKIVRCAARSARPAALAAFTTHAIGY
jgi:hypothetical protein